MISAMFGRNQMPRVSHRPMVPSYYLGIAVVIIAVLVGLLVMLWIPPSEDGASSISSQIKKLQQEIEGQSRVINSLNEEKVGLLQRVTKLKHMGQIDRESLSRVQDELKNDQNERLKMEEELVFLRSIVSSKSGNSILHLQRIKLQRGQRDNSFLFSFTVSKVLRAPEFIEGHVALVLTGEQDGVKLTLPLKQVTREKQDNMKMRFKHFQNMEVEFLLPGRFKPSGVTIEVKPTGKKFAPVKKNFEWVVMG